MIFALGLAAVANAGFEVDATKQGRVLPNVQQTVVKWALPKDEFRDFKRNEQFDILEFAEYVEIMGATGGNKDRDCFKNPEDRTKRDDYDFSHLLGSCRGIVALGLKPYLKLGNVPIKMSSTFSGGDFMMNVRPPDDFDEYGRYMTALAKKLMEEFGREELLKWRFAVLTEFENRGWFVTADGNAERTYNAYCRLYEVTVRSFADVVSPEITIGAHAMAVTEGLWDERRFVRFAAERKLPLKFITASFYDAMPGRLSSGFTLPKTIAHLRMAAEECGMTNLYYAVDEGRILNGKTRKRKDDALGMRIVGDTYQAAYDARIVKQTLESGAEYFAAWGYLSGPDTWREGLPSVSYYVSRESAKFKGMKQLATKHGGEEVGGVEKGVTAAISKGGDEIRIMAYAFTNELFASGTSEIAIKVKLPGEWRGRQATLETLVIDDNANWFDEWRKIRKEKGIGDDQFNWSPDDPAVLGKTGLSNAKSRKRFQDEFEKALLEKAQLKVERATVKVSVGGRMTLKRAIQNNAAVFFVLRK